MILLSLLQHFTYLWALMNLAHLAPILESILIKGCIEAHTLLLAWISMELSGWLNKVELLGKFCIMNPVSWADLTLKALRFTSSIRMNSISRYRRVSFLMVALVELVFLYEQEESKVYESSKISVEGKENRSVWRIKTAHSPYQGSFPLTRLGLCVTKASIWQHAKYSKVAN